MEEHMVTSAHSSHPTFSHTDDIAATWNDLLLLVGRVLLGWLFVALGYGKLGNISPTAAYFASFGLAPAEFGAWFAGCAQIVFGAAMILGIATRYAAVATSVCVLISNAIAHRYWAYPASAQLDQYN